MNTNMAMSVNEMNFLLLFCHTGSFYCTSWIHNSIRILVKSFWTSRTFFHMFLQQAFFSTCASSALGWDNVTALIEPRVTSLLLTFLWISERNSNDNMIMVMRPSACIYYFKPDWRGEIQRARNTCKVHVNKVWCVQNKQ